MLLLLWMAKGMGEAARRCARAPLLVVFCLPPLLLDGGAGILLFFILVLPLPLPLPLDDGGGLLLLYVP